MVKGLVAIMVLLAGCSSPRPPVASPTATPIEPTPTPTPVVMATPRPTPSGSATPHLGSIWARSEKARRERFLKKRREEKRLTAVNEKVRKKRMAELRAQAEKRNAKLIKQAQEESRIRALTYHDEFFLESHGPEVDPDTETLYAGGQIKNIPDRTFRYVQVEVSVYDKSGALVDSSMDNVNNLEPGQVWKFRALVSDKRASTFKVKDITGY